MRDSTPRDPPADGGYPLDSDLHQMSDDGGPVGPDPARWTDPGWRDSLEDRDTFEGESRNGFPDASRPLEDFLTVVTHPDIDQEAASNPPQSGPQADQPGGQPAEAPTTDHWSSVRVEGTPGTIWTARRSTDGGGRDT